MVWIIHYWRLVMNKDYDKVISDLIVSGYVKSWKTVPSYYSWLRGGIRRMWGKHPVKMEFLKKQKHLITNPNEKTKTRFPQVMGCKCSICHNDFIMKDIEVDHKDGGTYTLRKSEDVGQFILNILFVSPDDLQTVCKGCHGILSYQAKEGIPTFEEAKMEKFIIYITKTANKVEMNKWYKSRGIIPESNLAKRKKQIREVLKKEML